MLNATLCDRMDEYFEYFIFSQSNHRQIVNNQPGYIQELAEYYFDGNFTDCADTLTEVRMMAGQCSVFGSSCLENESVILVTAYRRPPGVLASL